MSFGFVDRSFLWPNPSPTTELHLVASVSCFLSLACRCMYASPSIAVPIPFLERHCLTQLFHETRRFLLWSASVDVSSPVCEELRCAAASFPSSFDPWLQHAVDPPVSSVSFSNSSKFGRHSVDVQRILSVAACRLRLSRRRERMRWPRPQKRYWFSFRRRVLDQSCC